MRKLLMILLMTMATIVVNAENALERNYVISVSQNAYTAVAGQRSFTEPEVSVKSKLRSSEATYYNLTYSISDPDNTGTTVDESTGDVEIGDTAGKVTVTVAATLGSSNSLFSNALSKAALGSISTSYDIDVSEDKILIGSYTEAQVAGEQKFGEPTVRVVNETQAENGNYSRIDETQNYDIIYSFCDAEGNELSDLVTLTEDGVTYKQDPVTLSTINVSTGDVIMGTSGDLYILITATPTSDYVSSKVVTNFYHVLISKNEVTQTFYPDYTPTDLEGFDGELRMETGEYNVSRAVINGTGYLLPTYKISTTLSSGSVADITDQFDVAIEFTGDASNTPEGRDDAILTYDSSAGVIKYDAKYGDVTKEKNWLKNNGEGVTGTLKYTFTPNSSSHVYEPFTKTIRVHFTLNEGTSRTLSLLLTREMITQMNVTENEAGEDTIHVYKWGQGEGNYYAYAIPHPALMSSSGQQLTTVNSPNTSYFTLLYEIVTDSTYYDDCDYWPTQNSTFGSSGIKQAGESTGATVSYTHFSSGGKWPGLIKVKVQAAQLKEYVDVSYNNTALETMYSPIKDDKGNNVVVNVGGTEYYAYTEPVYFYVDFMHRRPSLKFDPDPNDLIFQEGEVLTMTSRFTVTAYMDDSSNNVAEELDMSNSGNSDPYIYEVFISDRNRKFLKVSDWPMYDGCSTNLDANGFCTHWLANGGDGYSYKARELVYDDHAEGDDEVYKIGVGDSIKLSDGSFVVITAGNLSDYQQIHPYIMAGDYEWGVKYLSMKGWGNENWKITFLAEGMYTVPYTLRTNNHVKWDKSTEIAVRFVYSKSGTLDTKIKLGYTFQTAVIGQEDFEEPSARVVLPSLNNRDVTDEYDLSYKLAGTAQVYDVNSNSGWVQDETVGIWGPSIITEGDYIIVYNGNNSASLVSEEYGKKYPVLYYYDKATGTKLYPDGSVVIGNKVGDVYVVVSGTRKATSTNYGNPADETYRIRILDGTKLANWEVISSCKDCSGGTRYSADELIEHYGKMHFISTGEVPGGQTYLGVPGIRMTIGAPADSYSNDNEWETVGSTAADATTCCEHETTPVVTYNENPAQLDADGIPQLGSFFKFMPTTNGFLSIDARFYKDKTYRLICKNTKTGNIEIEDIVCSDITAEYEVGERWFTHPLFDGQEYYLYELDSSIQLDGPSAATNEENQKVRLHGFSFQPAFITDRNTTKEESEAPIYATTFANGLSTLVPALVVEDDSNVTYEMIARSTGTEGDTPDGIDISDYLGINSKTGDITFKQLTYYNGSVFRLRVKATISAEGKYKGCLTKYAYYDVRGLEIPTYMVQENQVAPNCGDVVSTTNIPTDIKMTYGGWNIAKEIGETTTINDSWINQSKTGGGGQIGGIDDDSPYIIDGFKYFMSGANNPRDENNKGAYNEENGNTYSFASGRKYEENKDFFYNTTYRIPCRGDYLKFEPRESGTLIVYVVQNGCINYYDNVKSSSNPFKVQWKPLHIVDQIGRPVEMTNNFAGSDLLTNVGAEGAANLGAYTLGIARCSKKLTSVTTNIQPTDEDEYNTSFDWSDFKGTKDDIYNLLAAWPEYGKGKVQNIIRLDNGGYVLPFKAYVRYSFDVKAGNTYFIFQPGSKFLFGGFSFVPDGFPDKCKYQIKWGSDGKAVENEINQEITFNMGNGTAAGNTDKDAYKTDATFTWNNIPSMFDKHDDNTASDLENVNIIINDRRYSEVSGTSPTSDAGTIQTRSFKEGMYDGICFPFSVSSSECERVFGKDYELITCEGTKDGCLYFIRHANTHIEAGRPYFVKPTQDGTYEFHNVTIEGTQTVNGYGTNGKDGMVVSITEPTRFNVDIDNYTFKGVYIRETMSAGSYHMENQDALYKYVDTNGNDVAVKIGGYRAYLRKNTSTSSSSKALTFTVKDLTPEGDADSDNNTTGVMIVSIDGEITTVPNNAGLYNVNGQKLGNSPLDLNNAPSGIYIINGKKIVK